MPSADIVIIIIVLLSSAIGLARGFLEELLSLIIWFSAIVLALYFSTDLADMLDTQVGDESVRHAVGFFVVFILVLIAGWVLQWLARQLISKTGLTGTDRFFGFLFGSARGVLVCIVALIALKSFEFEARWWHDSIFIPELLAFEQDVLELMGKARDVVIDVADQV